MAKEVKLLKDYDLDYIKQQYNEKNESLEEFGQEVNVWGFYEDIFGSLAITTPAIDKPNNRILQLPLEQLIDASCGQDGIFLSACTYYKNYYNSRGLTDIYAFVIDLDSCWSGGLDSVLRNKWQNNSKGNYHLPPTYIVNSGTGLHLYYVLEKPVPAFSKQLLEIKNLYRKMAVHQSMRPFVGARPEVHWVGQAFRMPGTLTKDGMLVRAFKMDCGQKYSIQELSAAYGVNYKFRYRGEHEDYPEYDKQKNEYAGTKKKGWYTNRAFFDYCVRNIPDKTQQGHRYMTMCALSAIAFKCNVPKWELQETLHGFLPDWNKGKVGTDRVERWEIRSAMKMYNARAFEMRREVIEEYFGWNFEPIKRRKGKEYIGQEKHLMLARGMLALRKQMGMTSQGRKSSQETVMEWREAHPDGRKVDCIKDTGLSKTTVYKWWRKIEEYDRLESDRNQLPNDDLDEQSEDGYFWERIPE